MSKRIFLYPDRDAIQWQWLRSDATGRTEQGQTSAQALSELDVTGCHIIMVLPGCDVRHVLIDIPGNKRALLAAAPFMIEEQLSQPLEQYHIACSAPTQQHAHCYAVLNTSMQRWLEPLAHAAIEPQWVIADYQLLTAIQQEPTIIWQQGEHVLYADDQTRCAVSEAALPLVLARTGAKELVYYHAPDRAPAAIPNVEATAQTASLLELAAKQWPPKSTLTNLLQGRYKQQGALENLWSGLRWPMVAAIALIVVVLGGLIVDNMMLKRQSEALAQAQTEIYRATFPNARRIVNPVSQMRAQLKQVTSNEGENQLLQWLNQGAKALGQADIELLNFRYTANALRIQIQAPDYRRVEQLSEELTAAGLEIQLGTLVKNGSRVSGLVTISGGQSAQR